MTAPVALVVSPADEPSGHPVIPRFLDLLEQGWNVHLVSSDGPVPGLDTVAEDAAARVHVLRGRGRALRRTRPVADALRTLRAGLVHFPSPMLAREWLRGFGGRSPGRIVVGFDGEDLALAAIEDDGRHAPLWERAAALHLETAALAELVRRCGVSEDAAVVVPPVPDAALLAADPPRDRAAGSPLRILGVGPLSWTQGYEYALAAVRRLRDRGVRCEYRVVGTGEFADAVYFARYQLGLDDVVEIVEPGGADALHEHLWWADVVLSAAVAPTSPKTILDAQARALPVVTTEAPPAGEAGAIVVARRDADALADGLASLDGDARSRELGEAGRRACRAMSLSMQLERFRELYERVLHEPQPRVGGAR